MDDSVAIALTVALGSDEGPRKQGKWSKPWLLQRPTFEHANFLKEIRISEPEDCRDFYVFSFVKTII